MEKIFPGSFIASFVLYVCLNYKFVLITTTNKTKLDRMLSVICHIFRFCLFHVLDLNSTFVNNESFMYVMFLNTHMTNVYSANVVYMICLYGLCVKV